MENSLSIQTIIQQKNDYNLAIPFTESRQVNPYYKLSVSLLHVNTDERASEFFKVGSKHMGNQRYEDMYSLTKTFLNKLATEAGIQFAPGTGDVSRIDENTWKASAFGALRLPDGSVRTSSNFKVIDLLTEEKKYRLSYEDKAVNGIVDYRAAKDAEKKYAGQWIDTGTTNGNGYPVKKYVVAAEERPKYIESSLLDAMAQLRANAPQKAVTGAILRVIRDLLGIKGTYTMDELKKPFAVARMSFSPDYNDPLVKQMMLQQGMQSIGTLFGMSPVTQTISLPQYNTEEDEVDIPAEPIEANYPVEPTTQAASFEPIAESRPQDFCCDKCGAVINEKVWDYSVGAFERPLCYKCQKVVKAERSGR